MNGAVRGAIHGAVYDDAVRDAVLSALHRAVYDNALHGDAAGTDTAGTESYRCRQKSGTETGLDTDTPQTSAGLTVAVARV